MNYTGRINISEHQSYVSMSKLLFIYQHEEGARTNLAICFMRNDNRCNCWQGLFVKEISTRRKIAIVVSSVCFSKFLVISVSVVF